MIEVVDRQLVAHCFAFADGPHADEAYAHLRELWFSCRSMLSMADPVPGTRLPHYLPESRRGLPEFPSATARELGVAAQERRGADYQAIFRRHYDALALSAALAPQDAGTRRIGEVRPVGWDRLDQEWSSVVGPHVGGLVWEARFYCARTAPGCRLPDSVRETAEQLRPLLPPGAESPGWTGGGTVLEPGLVMWEIAPDDDQRVQRRFLIVAEDGREGEMSDWIWSNGTTAIPPLARYLLQMAKVRYLLRLWDREKQVHELRSEIDDKISRLGQLRPVNSTPGEADQIDDAVLDALRAIELASATTEIALDEVGQQVDIALTNVRTILGHAYPQLASHGFVSADVRLAEWFREQVAADRRALETAGRKARHHTGNAELRRRPAPTVKEETMPQPTVPADDVSRNVFVVHGRDEPLRDAMFDFLRALSLRPLEWEHAVDLTGSGSPVLGSVPPLAIASAQATVVLLSPDDVVWLHPELCAEGETDAEARPQLQARPNVMIELGMALAIYPGKTIIVQVGDMRPAADLGGLNYVKLDGTTKPLNKIASRLHFAGCKIDRTGDDWLSTKRFAGLTAYHRKPSGG